MATERWHHQAPTLLWSKLWAATQLVLSCPVLSWDCGEVRDLWWRGNVCFLTEHLPERPSPVTEAAGAQSRKRSLCFKAPFCWGVARGEELPLVKQALKLHHGLEPNPLQDIV